MYGIVLPTLFLICSGIVYSKPTTPSFTTTTVLLSTGFKNCSNQYINTVLTNYEECTTGTKLLNEFKNPTPNGFLIFKEYCNTHPYEQCFHNASSKFSECSQDHAILRMTILLSQSVNSYFTFWCYDQASRMKTYYAERIPFCLAGKKMSINSCVFPVQNTNVCEVMFKSFQCHTIALQECNLTESAIKLFKSSYDDLRKVCPK